MSTCIVTHVVYLAFRCCCNIQLGSHYKAIILGETAAKAFKELKKKIANNREQANSQAESLDGKTVTPEQKVRE